MEKLVIEGGVPLHGEVRISGSKNAALPILPAAILSCGEVKLRRVPDLDDVRTMLKLLDLLGVKSTRNDDGSISMKCGSDGDSTAPYDLVSQMRASFCVLGPLLGRRGKARVSLPGGCAIGVRPVDLHLKGLKALGAKISIDAGYVTAEGKLEGAEIYLGGPAGSSVTGTANVLMAAVTAKGRTIIESAACEPEVEDLARFLTSMGAKIKGAGSPRIEVEGVEFFDGCEHDVIGDRIEAGTFMTAAAITGGNVKIGGVSPSHLAALVHKMRETGASVERDGAGVRVVGSGRPEAVDATALPYPGFPTDMQAQLTALLCVADGISVVTDKIYPDRFMQVAELNRMGARIRKEGGSAIIDGQPFLTGAPVMASDLRAGACLVVAGLAARGVTEVNRLYHLDRGYEAFDEKLRALGARIRRVDE